MLLNWARIKQLAGVIIVIAIVVAIFSYKDQLYNRLRGVGWLFPGIDEQEAQTSLGVNALTMKVVTEAGEIPVTVETARTNDEISTGLMERASLCEDCGMLFYLPEDSQTSFWMKDCKIPLDMIFVGTDLKIIDIKKNLQPCIVPPCELYRPDSPYTYVLEVNGGWSDTHSVVPQNNIILP